MNHSCQPNAASVYDETARVAILFSQKDIQPGEEISISYYYPFYSKFPPAICYRLPNWSLEEELAEHKFITLSFFGITCPADCSCNDPVIRDLVHEGRQIFHRTILNLFTQNKVEEALEAGDKLQAIHRRLNLSWIDRGDAEYLLFQIAVAKSETLPRAMEYIRSAVELFGNICPYSEGQTKKYEKLLEHPDRNYNYLLIDKNTR